VQFARYHRFGGIYYFHLHGRRYPLNPEDGGSSYSETLVPIYQTTRQSMTKEKFNFNIHHRENFSKYLGSESTQIDTLVYIRRYTRTYD
jgi:hypothetical protein